MPHAPASPPDCPGPGHRPPPAGRLQRRWPAAGPRPPVIDGIPTSATLSAEQKTEVDRLTALQTESAGLTADQLLARRAVPFQAQLGYDPKTAKNLDLIQASALKLDAAELAALGKNGFVISDKRRYPHFGYGYKTIYSQDLPVYISADSILQAVHQSYDDMLEGAGAGGADPRAARRC